MIIVPFCEYFDSFQAFEGVLQAINAARKDAKDFVTDVSIEKMETCSSQWKYVYIYFASYGMNFDLCEIFFEILPIAYILMLVCVALSSYSFNINGASLHPRYGEKTPKEIIEELEKFEAEGEIDLNLVEQTKRKNQARRSPYPTLIIELQATPPIPVDATYDPIPSLTDEEDDLTKRGVLKDVVGKLESIFAKSAVLHKKTEIKKSGEDAFYDAISTVSFHFLQWCIYFV